MKLLRSLLRIATTVSICMAIIAIVTIVMRPQVLRDWPGDYAADPVVQLTNNFTPVRLAHASSGALQTEESAPAERNFLRPVDDGESGWVLAQSQPAPVEAPVAIESPDESAPARPTGEEFDPKNVDSAAEPDVQLVPESYTIRAEPQGRVRIEGENGYSLEASEITLENAPAHGDSDRPSTVSENVGDHTLPEFLRGRDLPPLAPGEKAVTVHVPVDNWVDLSAGDLVDVRSERPGAGVNSDAGVEGTIHINELERVEIYALPGIAPENSDTVPVCLKVNAPQARLLIKLRAAKTPVRLMVVKSSHAAADAYRVPSSPPTATRQPLRSEDDFADPAPVRTPPASGDAFRLPEAAPTPVGDPIVPVRVVPVEMPNGDFAPTRANGPKPQPQSELPADDPVDNRVPPRSWDDLADPTPARKPQANGEDFQLPEAQPTTADNLIDLRGRDDFPAPAANGRTPVPESDLPANESTPIATAEPQPAPAARLNAESLPAIEPSEEGTVIPLDGKPLSLTVETTQIVESELQIQRVSGFDPKVIRITPLTPLRLKIEALAPGRTSLRVEPAARQEMMMLAPFRVEVHVIGKLVGELNLQFPTYSPNAGDNRPATIAQQFAPDSRDQQRKEAEDTLRKLYPKASLEFIWLRDSLILRGEVAEQEMNQIVEIAQLLAPKVHNQLRVKDALVPDEDVQTLKQPETTHTVHLTLPGNRGSTLSPRQRVDVIEQRVVRNQSGREEAMERKIAENVEVADVHIGSGQVLVRLRVTEEIANRLGDIDHFSLQVVPHAAETYEAPGARMLSPTTTDGVPSEGVIGAVLGSDDAPKQAESIRLSNECRVAITPAGKLDVASCAKCHTDPPLVNLKLQGAEDPLRDDIRALHDDVRKLIELLERRAAVTPPEHGGPLPRPDDAQKPSNAVEPAGPAAPPKAPEAPQSPPESMTDAKRPKSVDRETAAFLERTWWLVGMRFAPIDPESPPLRTFVVNGGLVVQEIRPDSPVAKAGLEVGDVVIGVHDWETTDAEDFRYALNQMAEQKVWDVTFHVIRAEQRLTQKVVLNWVDLEPPPHGTTESFRQQPEGTAAVRGLGLNPQAAARKKLLDEIGRVILRRDYPRALELAETYQAADPNTEFAAIKKIGPENVPVLAVATVPWSAPCQKLQPLLTKLQNDGYGLVILDSDDAADAELIQQLKINAFPTLACVVDGSKKGELVGFFNQTRFDQFFNQFGDTIQEMLDKLESNAGESQPGIKADIPAATTQSVREPHGDVRAVDFNRTFNFYVGFAR